MKIFYIVNIVLAYGWVGFVIAKAIIGSIS